MLTEQDLIELALSTKEELQEKKDAELRLRKAREQAKNETYDRLYRDVVLKYISVMKSVNFKYQTHTPRYVVCDKHSANPALRLCYRDGGQSSDNIYIDIMVDEKKTILKFTGTGIIGFETNDISEPSIDRFLQKAVGESMKIMVNC